jgi:ELWxxDGT repeat protein
MADGAGNSPKDARRIGLGDRNRIFQDSIGPRDPIDFYRFRLNRASQVTLNLRDLEADASLQLFTESNLRRPLVQAGEPLVSDNPERASEVLTATLQANTTYFLKVVGRSGETDYTLDTVAVPTGPGPRPPRVPPVGRARLRRALPITVARRNRTYEGFVSSGNPEDFYRFRLASNSSFSLLLRGLDDNANVELLDSTGRRLRQSAFGGTSSEVISVQPPRRLLRAKSDYYIRVFLAPGSDRTNYRLEVQATPDEFGSPTEADPRRDPQLVRDLNSGSNNGNPSDFVAIDSVVFFAADDSTNGRELWRSGGTRGGTSRVLDIRPGADSSAPTDLVNVNGILYFAANDGVNGRELWRSDGTEAGTFRVDDIRPGREGSNPTGLVNFNGMLLFAADDGATGKELWRSGGSAANTRLVSNLNTNGIAGSNPTGLTVFNNAVYFAADDGNSGRELWRSDGTTTQRVMDLNPGSNGSSPTDFAVLGDRLYFAADNGSQGRELWQTDGTGVNTRLVRDINPGSNGSNPTSLVAVGDFIYFAADNGSGGNELWRTNSTRTENVANLNGGSQGSDPRDLININGVLYLTAVSSTARGRQIWSSRGTQNTTQLVTTDSPSDLNPADLVRLGNFILFSANSEGIGRELFRLQI